MEIIGIIIILLLILLIILISIQLKNKELLTKTDFQKVISIEELLNKIDLKTSELELKFTNQVSENLRNNQTTSEKITEKINSNHEISMQEFYNFKIDFSNNFNKKLNEQFAIDSKAKIELQDIITKKLSESEKALIELQTTIITKIDEKLKETMTLNERSKEEILVSLKVALDKNNQAAKEENEKIINLISNKLDDTKKQIDISLNTFKEQVKVLEKETENVKSLNEVVSSLNNTLTNVKKRGNFGEGQLEIILENIFGIQSQNVWAKQFTTQSGLRPDAVIKFNQPIGTIPIDSKFPFENYKLMIDNYANQFEYEKYKKDFIKDLKSHISKVALYNKETDLAEQSIMFLPFESIYIEICDVLPDVIVDAQKKNVWVVGPTTLIAVLTTLNQTQKKIEVTKNAKKIVEGLEKIETELIRWEERKLKMDKEMEKFNTTYKDFSRSEQKTRLAINKVTKLDK